MTQLVHNHCCCCCCQILNPAETFGDIIVDYSYVECTSACITALSAFDRLYPGSR
jgi:cycloartenol synthase